MYRKQIENLSGTLNADDTSRSEAIPILRSLIDSIVVHKRPGRGNVDLELFGSLSKIIDLGGGKNAKEVDVMTMMVAEECFGHYRQTRLNFVNNMAVALSQNNDTA